MSKKVFFIILGFSVVVTYISALAEVLINGSILAGESGFPFRFGYSSFFGGSGINYPVLLLDIAFWFLVIWALWKVLQKVISKK